ncbi:hypothetical protein [Kitasatospora kifunensis]|uniref:histidine kinase n=1 Tax=Kitasatospora kifunensis TaxID=58351 RepID=A0A7W7R8Q7_KITKI|nr:hypothetical protein [Kitasatospora kifunensis]MBB4927487.1 K+-sensing histidine kinase KdpD [Kitasatospora kifunensis]
MTNTPTIAVRPAHRSQEQTQAQAQAQARRELLAWISHDLHAPLCELLAVATTLATGDTEGAADHVLRLRAGIEQLTGVADDLCELLAPR